METAATQEPFAGPQVSLQEYVLILHRRRWLFVAVFVTVFATMAVRLMVATPIYRATAKVLYQAKAKAGEKDVLYELTGMRGTRPVQTQVEVIRSGVVVADAMEKTGIEPQQMPRIAVEYIEETDVIAVSCESPEKKRAADFANALADAYVALTLKQNQQAADAGLEFVRKRLREAADALRQLEEEVQVFREDEGIAASEGSTASLGARVQVMTDAVQQLRATVASGEAALVKLRAQNAAKRPDVVTGGTSVMTNPRIADLRLQLKNLEIQRASLAAEYSPSSTVIRPIDQQIKEIREQLDSERAEVKAPQTKMDPLGAGLVPKIVDTETQLVADRARLAKAEEALAEATRDFERAPAVQRQMAGLQRELTMAEDLYTSLSARQRELRLLKESELPAATVVEEAATPRSHVWPNRTRTMAMAIALALSLALLSVVVAQYLDGRFISLEDVGRVLGAPVLAAIPSLPDGEDAMLHLPMGTSRHAETYRLLRSSLHPQVIKRPIHTVLVAGLEHEEGRTTVAANLAIAYAEAKHRVLIVDADLRRGNMAEALGLPNEIGLAQCIADGAEPARVVRQTAHPSLSALPSGPLPPNPAELLSSDRMLELLRELQEEWDVIVLDSSPSLGLSDAHVLASTCDAALLVLDMTRATRSQLRPVAETLRRQGAFVPGAVANRFGSRFVDYGSEQGPDEGAEAPPETPGNEL